MEKEAWKKGLISGALKGLVGGAAGHVGAPAAKEARRALMKKLLVGGTAATALGAGAYYGPGVVRKTKETLGNVDKFNKAMKGLKSEDLSGMLQSGQQASKMFQEYKPTLQKYHKTLQKYQPYAEQPSLMLGDMWSKFRQSDAFWPVILGLLGGVGSAGLFGGGNRGYMMPGLMGAGMTGLGAYYLPKLWQQYGPQVMQYLGQQGNLFGGAGR